MTAAVAGLCAAGVTLAALHRPPRAGRLRRPARTRHAVTLATVLETLGGTLRRAAGRRPHPPADRRVGGALAVAAIGILVGVEIAALVLAAALLRRRWLHLRATRVDARPDVERDLPDLVDLLALAVGAGLSVPAALPLVAPVAPPALRADLRAAVDAIRGGRATDDAVIELGRRWGPPARPLVHAIADHLRYGTQVLPALERVAVEARAGRRRAAETRARKLPVLLLFPLVLCTLPAFGLLTVAPLVAGTFDALSGSRLEAPASPGP